MSIFQEIVRNNVQTSHPPSPLRPLSTFVTRVVVHARMRAHRDGASSTPDHQRCLQDADPHLCGGEASHPAEPPPQEDPLIRAVDKHSGTLFLPGFFQSDRMSVFQESMADLWRWIARSCSVCLHSPAGESGIGTRALLSPLSPAAPFPWRPYADPDPKKHGLNAGLPSR